MAMGTKADHDIVPYEPIDNMSIISAVCTSWMVWQKDMNIPSTSHIVCSVWYFASAQYLYGMLEGSYKN